MYALLIVAALAVHPCTASEYRQFDFFIGDWDTYDVAHPDSLVARNRVTQMVGGCALREVCQQADGLRGESFSTWDAARRVWHQSWVTNKGQLLLMDGKLEGGQLRFTTMPGSPQTIRVAWWNDGTNVREKAESSADGGTTWEVLFDIVFRPHAPKHRTTSRR